MSEPPFSLLSPYQTGIAGRCPRCGQGRLFQGFLSLAPQCRACGLDYDFSDSGDGPAVFVILFVGFLIVGGVLWLEFNYAPPYWVHAVIWVPLTLLISLLVLRPLKGVMIALQYVNKARQAVLTRDL